jgi:hypothetical protein
MDEQGMITDLIIFLADQGPEEQYPLRKIWHEGRFYFSVLDVLTALQVAATPRKYWPQLKERLKQEGFDEAVNRILQFRGACLRWQISLDGLRRPGDDAPAYRESAKQASRAD